MIKFDTGSWIENADGERKSVVIHSKSPCKIGDILIGGGAILFGAVYLMLQSFKSGAREFENAEYETLDSLGLLKGKDIEDKEV